MTAEPEETTEEVKPTITAKVGDHLLVVVGPNSGEVEGYEVAEAVFFVKKHVSKLVEGLKTIPSLQSEAIATFKNADATKQALLEAGIIDEAGEVIVPEPPVEPVEEPPAEGTPPTEEENPT